ncbi:unnamed protein product [Sympodiomycopsis kandeliae]
MRYFVLTGGLILLYLVFHTHRNSSPVNHLNTITSSSPSSIHNRIVAVADLHGDYQHALNVFRMAGLISSTDDELKWTGANSTLVSTGDIVDRGDDTILLYKMFSSLRSQAKQSGGQVLNCLGNHEIMNVLGDWRYVTRGDMDTFGNALQRKLAMSSDGWIGKEWLQHYRTSHTVQLFPLELVQQLQSKKSNPLPLHYSSPRANFVHGGIHPEWANLDDIVSTGHSLLSKALTYASDPSNDLLRGHLPPDTTPHEAQIWSENGPFWYRGYATEPSDHKICHLAKQATRSLGVDWLIMGHTPHFDGFIHRCEPPTIHLIDTGISRAYGGTQSALVFDGMLEYENGKWKETVRLIALYKARKPYVVHTRTTIIE